MIDSIPGLDISTSQRSDALEVPAAAGGAVIRRELLTPRDRDQMFTLFTRYFAQVTRSVFERDLAEKHWVIVLRDDDGSIAGFSTLMKMESQGRTVFFSGDTIVAEHRRGTADLARLWVHHIRSAAKGLGHDVFWFLISSGYRTYRFLPVFFREFHPRFDAQSHELKTILDDIAAQRFGAAYEVATGIVRLSAPSPLRDAMSDAAQRADHDPHVRFFLSANPGHVAGDELACIVRVAEDNLTPAGARMLR